MKTPRKACLFLLLTLVACRDIVVDPNDTTPPTLELVIGGHPVRTAAGDPVESPIATGAALVLEPDSAGRGTTVVYVASDSESSIRSIDGTIELRFQCVARVIGGTVSRAATASFSVHTNTPNAAGTTISDTEAAGIEITLNEAWRRAGCERWGQIIDVRDGTLRNITGTVRGTAVNNATRPGVTRFSGTLSYAEGSYRIGY